MSKTFRKFNNTKRGPRHSYDDDEENYSNRTSFTKKRVERNISNAIRSKNITKIMELDDNDDLDNDDLDVNVRR